jgi:hypothetical protein
MCTAQEGKRLHNRSGINKAGQHESKEERDTLLKEAVQAAVTAHFRVGVEARSLARISSTGGLTVNALPGKSKLPSAMATGASSSIGSPEPAALSSRGGPFQNSETTTPQGSGRKGNVKSTVSATLQSIVDDHRRERAKTDESYAASRNGNEKILQKLVEFITADKKRKRSHSSSSSSSSSSSATSSSSSDARSASSSSSDSEHRSRKKKSSKSSKKHRSEKKRSSKKHRSEKKRRRSRSPLTAATRKSAKSPSDVPTVSETLSAVARRDSPSPSSEGSRESQKRRYREHRHKTATGRSLAPTSDMDAAAAGVAMNSAQTVPPVAPAGASSILVVSAAASEALHPTAVATTQLRLDS